MKTKLRKPNLVVELVRRYIGDSAFTNKEAYIPVKTICLEYWTHRDDGSQKRNLRALNNEETEEVAQIIYEKLYQPAD